MEVHDGGPAGEAAVTPCGAEPWDGADEGVEGWDSAGGSEDEARDGVEGDEDEPEPAEVEEERLEDA